MSGGGDYIITLEHIKYIDKNLSFNTSSSFFISETTHAMTLTGNKLIV